MAAELLASWWAWIVTATLQASVLLGAVGLIDLVARRTAWPQVLSCLWWLALARLVLPLDVSSPLSVTQRVGATALEAARTTPQANVLAAIACVWVLGAAFVVLARIVRRRQLARSLQSVQLSPAWCAALERARERTRSRRTLRVAALPGLRGGALGGVARPTLLLPPSAWLREPTTADEHALVHELMHLRRGDLWKDELVALVRALFWFNPLVWQAAARLHQLSELACDRATAEALGEQAADYRTTLLTAAREWITAGAAAPTELRAFLGSRALLLARLEQLERSSTSPLPAVRGASALLTAFGAACVLPMAPSAPSLREQALAVLAAEQRGEVRSCFQLQAAARVLAADSQGSPHSP